MPIHVFNAILFGGTMKFVKTVLPLFYFFYMIIFINSPVLAKSYFVKPNGDDKNSGLSDSQAWETVDKVNSYNFSTGDDVYFKCNSHWKNASLTVDWDGTGTDPVVIGSYYVVADKVYFGVLGAKPIIDGSDVLPDSKHIGLVNVYNHNNITIKNLMVINSEGMAVSAIGATNITISGIETDNIYNAGIILRQSSASTITNCKVFNVGRKTVEDKTRRPASIAALKGSDNIIISNNIVENCYAEGIGAYGQDGFPVSNVTIEDNQVYDNDFVAIYADDANHVWIRRNLVYGTTRRPRDGIAVNTEARHIPPYYTHDIHIYGNFIGGASNAIKLNAAASRATLKNIFVYNNTAVSSINYNFKSAASGNQFSNVEIKNNISWAISGGHTSFPSSSGIIWDNNLWSSKPSTVCMGPNDPPYSPPLLAKTSGWNSIYAGNLDFSDFSLQTGSPAIAAGTPLSISYKDLLNCNFSSNLKSTITSSAAKSVWDIGADIYDPSFEVPNSDLQAPLLKVSSSSN
jgi:co-chaperonin GroES (HSP10)